MKKRLFSLTLVLSLLLAINTSSYADTAHFSSSEFKCSCCGQVIVSQELMEKLEELRTKLGNRPIYITSGYRCPSHNAAVGGVPNSQHLYGRAADIVVSGVSASAVADAAEEIFANGGLGRYNTFTHVDVRGYRARW